MIDTFIYLFAFVFVLSIVVVVHEFGHFIVARLCGVKVTNFSVGFGRVLWSRTDKKGTVWQVCLWPLGGYVKMLGDEDAASAKTDVKKVPARDRKYMFATQKIWKKMAIIAAGPAMNYAFAILVLAGLFFFVGKVFIPPVIGEFGEQSSAKEAGMQVGDRFVRVNGVEVKEYMDLLRIIRVTEFGKKLNVEADRNGELLTFVVEPRYFSEMEDNLPRIGIMAARERMVEKNDLNIFQSFGEAGKTVYIITTDTLTYLGQVLFEKRSADDMRGPLGIAEASGDALKGGMLSLILFVVNISVAIGFMNLLPVPILDGGHLVFYAIEGITGRPLSERIQNGLLYIGMGLLIFLLAFTMYLDVPRILQRIFE